MNHDPFALGENQPEFVPQRRRGVLDEIEQTLPAGPDVGAVLNVVRRPITFGLRVVALIKQRVKSFKEPC
jgi:hypothetical protein